MASKNSAASTAHSDIKIVELATELGVDPREVVAAGKDMAMENAKVPASWVTGGQADRLRARFGGNQNLKEQVARRQRAAEIIAANLPAAPEPAPVPQPVLGKKTYEKDRRGVFGVVETPGGNRVEPVHVEKHKPARHAPAAVSSEPAKNNLLVQLPEAKKFVGVQVPEPVRREPQAADPRFGVVAPPPVEERPAVNAALVPPAADLWGKLNDGRPALDLTTAAPSAPAPAEPIEEEPATLPPLAEDEIEEISSAAEVPAVAVAAPVRRAAEPEEIEDDDYEPDDKEKVFAPPPPRIHEVPVKRAPAHKAFGAKRKLKHSHHKVIAATPSHKKAEKHARKPHVAEHPKKAEPKAHEPHAHAAKHGKHGNTTKKESLLRRLARRLLGK